MAQAISTKYLGATNTRGGHIKVVSCFESKTYRWEHSWTESENHRAALYAYVAYLNSYRSSDSQQWCIKAIGDNADGKGITAIIDLE